MMISRLDLALVLPLICCGTLSAGQESRTPQTRSLEKGAAARQVPSKAASEFRKSQEAFNEGKIDKAVQHLRNGIAIDPGNTDAYNDLGVIYYNINQPEKAIRSSTMIEIDPLIASAPTSTWPSPSMPSSATRNRSEWLAAAST